jgi:uncharacterized protein YegJ (DUF2314 family)
LRIALVVILLLAAAYLWWRYLYVARPAVPPLTLRPDDPLIAAARAEARATVPKFRALLAEAHRGARVKVAFHSNAGVTEFLWAEVLSLDETQMAVRYLTPPVTHVGRLERLHLHKLNELEDWMVELPSGRYVGGFTMRAMFTRARQQWGELPPALADEERRYD